jgi:Holliday junction resolvase-like predicted endonuclease
VTKLKPREQGDLGELSAMEWLASRGAHIYVPVGHSPDVDLIAEISGVVSRVEVKTSTQQRGHKWAVHIATRGGNQSWSGLVKHFDRSRCEFLFVHVGDGRRWFIPTGALDCESNLTLGGPKYSEFEIEPGRPLAVRSDDPVLQSPRSPGEYRSGQTGCAVNAVALSFRGSNPLSPISSSRPVKPTNYERKPGQNGEAVINQKRRLTIPQRPFFEAGFANGGRVRVRADGPGRLLVEQIELPDWAK